MAEKDLRENPFRDEIFGYLVEYGYQVSNLDDYDHKHALAGHRYFKYKGEWLNDIRNRKGV